MTCNGPSTRRPPAASRYDGLEGVIVSETPELVIEHESVGAKARVTARWRGEPAHIDVIDLASAAQRARFCAAVEGKLLQAAADLIDRELLKLADAPASNTTATDLSAELDLSAIVRAEQFFTPEVCGLTAPVVVRGGDGPMPTWALYLRWADGKRERRELDRCIDLPSGNRLWLHPMPGEPALSAVPPWSSSARSAWLAGARAPGAADVFRLVCPAIAHYIDFSPDAGPGTTATLALWVLLTYGYRAFPAVPYLFVGGAMGSGKSRLFDLLARLVFRPLATSNITGPSLFRTLHDRGG